MISYKLTGDKFYNMQLGGREIIEGERQIEALTLFLHSDILISAGCSGKLIL